MIIVETFLAYFVFYLKSQIELVFWICSHGQSLFFEALFLQKVGDTGSWLFRNCWKDFIGCVKIFSHNSCLVLKYRQFNRVRNNIQFFVSEEDTIY